MVELLILLVAGSGLPQLMHGQNSSQETLPQSVAPQPVAFSHRLHAGQLRQRCNFCHTGVDKGDEAKIPPVDLCLKCHREIKADSPEIVKLKAAHDEGKEVAWVPVYRVPDFVFFGHAQHVKAEVQCAECHGPVATRDVLQKEISTRMNFCLGCHQKRAARSDCSTCHQLGY